MFVFQSVGDMSCTFFYDDPENNIGEQVDALRFGVQSTHGMTAYDLCVNSYEMNINLNKSE